ncbi:MAG: META domain-containing protein [Muribaculaceae bacterium]|nr:META domain-containing protein [Muribaculaceae bacterium]
MNKSIIITAAAVLFLCSCNSRKVAVTTTGQVKTETATQTEGAIQKVLYGQWIATNINGTAVTGNDRPYMVFDESSTNPFIVNLYAYDGCNILNGALAVTPGGQMSRTSEFLSTMKMCPDAQYEIGFTMALNTVSKYSIEQVGRDYLLYIKNAQGNTTMTLRKSDLGFANGAWQVTKLNGTAVPTDVEMQMVIDIPEQKLHGNAGCNTMNGTIYMNPDKQNSLEFKNIATTRMTCPQIALEQQLLTALAQVTTVQLGKDGSLMLDDANCHTLVTLTKLNLK